MDKKPLIRVSILAVALLVVGSLSNVVGYQTVKSSNQNIVNEEVIQKELLFQTICDIVNNKEIQRIILKSQMNRGIFSTSEIAIVTKNQLRQMYILGVLLSRFISKSRIQSMIQRYQLQNPNMVVEINGVIEKDTTLNAELIQLQNTECDCDNRNTAIWTFPIICIILEGLLIFGAILILTSEWDSIIWWIGVIIASFVSIVATLLHCPFYTP